VLLGYSIRASSLAWCPRVFAGGTFVHCFRARPYFAGLNDLSLFGEITEFLHIALPVTAHDGRRIWHVITTLTKNSGWRKSASNT